MNKQYKKDQILSLYRAYQIGRHEALGMLEGIGYTRKGAERVLNNAGSILG